MSGAKSKRKGNAYEQQIAREMSEIYGEKIYTNRFVNKLADDKGVDISTPHFSYQLKNTKTNINYSSLINEISGKNKEDIVLLSKITYKGEFAIMSKELFYRLIKNYIGNAT